MLPRDGIAKINSPLCVYTALRLGIGFSCRIDLSCHNYTIVPFVAPCVLFKSIVFFVLRNDAAIGVPCGYLRCRLHFGFRKTKSVGGLPFIPRRPMPTEIKATRHDSTLVLTLCDSGGSIVLHPEIAAAAIETLATAERDSSIRAVILACADHFSSSEFEKRSPQDSASAASRDALSDWIEALRDCPKPIIAAIEGRFNGAGFAITLGCDLIVAGASAQFLMDTASDGWMASDAGARMLSRALSHQLNMEMLLADSTITAERLYQLGLINRVVAPGTALDVALEWAERLVLRAPAAVERIKAALRVRVTGSVTNSVDAEHAGHVDKLRPRDAHQAITDFFYSAPHSNSDQQ